MSTFYRGPTPPKQLMDSDIKYKDVDWSQFRPWNIDQQTLQNAWDT